MSDISERPLPRRTIFIVCCLGMITLSFITAAPAVCLTSIGTDLNLSDTQRGAFVGTPLWGLMAAILLAGPIADRCGFRMLIVLGAALQIGGLAAISWAPNYSVTLFGAVLAGMGTGAMDALMTPIVCAVYPERRTRMSNLLHAFYAIGLVLSVILVTLLLHLAVSWRMAFRALAALVVPYMFVMLVLPLPGRSHAGPQRQPISRLLGRRSFWLLMAAIFLGGATELGVSAWVPSFLEKVTNVSRTRSGLSLAAFGATLAVGRLAASFLAHRLGPRRLLVAGGLLCAISLALIALPVGASPSIFFLALTGLGVAGVWPTVLGCAGDRFPRAGASMFSLLSAMGAAGAAIGPLAVGVVADHSNLSIAMGALAVVPLLALLAIAGVSDSEEKP